MYLTLIGLACLGLSHAVSAGRLLQFAPPASRGVITLHPARHPEHEAQDLNHLVPRHDHSLYYSQDGHRAPVHGSKHAQLDARFQRPTVILDHSDRIKKVTCTDDTIEVCFQDSAARDTAARTWKKKNNEDENGVFHIATYHTGCGDLTATKRSYFRAMQPATDSGPSCLRVGVVPIDETEALKEGKVVWRTYRDPLRAGGKVGQAKSAIVKKDDSIHNDDKKSDINTDAAAANRFFNVTDIHSGEAVEYIPLIEADGTVDAEDDPPQQGDTSHRHALSSVVVQGLSKDTRDVAEWAQEYEEARNSFLDQMANAQTSIHGNLAEECTMALDRNYHHNEDGVNATITPTPATQGPPILGRFGSLVYTQAKPPGSSSTQKYAVAIECIQCGIDGSFTVEGEFAFSVLYGITAGSIILDTSTDINIHTVLGVTAEGRNTLAKYRHQLGVIPISPISVPGLFTLGPQISFSVQVDFKLVSKAQFIFGGTTTLSPGRAVLDFIEEDDSAIEDGLEPSFQPRFEAKGSFEARVSLGIPIGIEVGVNALNGRFKATIGLVDTPAVYLSATKSAGYNSPCEAQDGVELRAGVKNKVAVVADLKPAGSWELELNKLTIYERGLGCLSLDGGLDTTAVLPEKNVFADVARTLGEDLAVDESTPVQDLSEDLTDDGELEFYAIVMDEAGTSTLISGSDGYIYLADSSEHDGLGQTWGTAEPGSGLLSFDALGRLIAYNEEEFEDDLHAFMTVPRMVDTTDVQQRDRFAMIARVDPSDMDSPLSIVLGGNLQTHYIYPTFCRIPGKGTRLYATRYLIHDGGKVDNSAILEFPDADQYFEKLGLDQSSCATVRLVSSAPVGG